jgi:hypothetical protein
MDELQQSIMREPQWGTAVVFVDETSATTEAVVIQAVEKPRRHILRGLVDVAIAMAVAALTLGWAALLVRAALWLVWG